MVVIELDYIREASCGAIVEVWRMGRERPEIRDLEFADIRALSSDQPAAGVTCLNRLLRCRTEESV